MEFISATDDEEDSHTHPQTDNEQTTDTNMDEEDTIYKQTEKMTTNKKEYIPCTHTQEDIDNIPDTVEANNVDSNLNDAQLPYLNVLYGESYMKQTRQPSLSDTGASFTFMHITIFKRISSNELYIKSKKPLKIKTAHGKILNDEAIIAIIPMTFKDKNNEFHTISTLFLIVSVISVEVFMGNNLLLRCKIFTNINKHTIDYKNPKQKQNYDTHNMD